MASQGYYNQGGPQYPQQSYGPPQGYNQGYGPPQGYNQGPPMQYQQGPPQQVVVKQKKDRGCLTAWLERVDSIGMCDEGDDQEAILESEGGTSRWQNPDEEVLFDWKGE